MSQQVRRFTAAEDEVIRAFMDRLGPTELAQEVFIRTGIQRSTGTVWGRVRSLRTAVRREARKAEQLARDRAIIFAADAPIVKLPAHRAWQTA